MWHTVFVFGCTKIKQASRITSHAKIASAGGSPLILQACVVVAAGLGEVVEGFVETLTDVDGVAGVVEIASVVLAAVGV